MRSSVSLVLAVLVLLAPISFYAVELTRSAVISELEKTAQERLVLYESTLRAALNKYSYLPFILANNETISAALVGKGGVDSVNRYLEFVNSKAGSENLFVTDHRGVVIASSNWKSPRSYIGQDYSFRPYFIDAMNSMVGTFFAVGVTSGEPGFFISHPIWREDRIVGVSVVKIDLSSLQDNWQDGGETIFVTDVNGVIFLSSNRSWIYHTLSPLDETVLKKITENRQYFGRQLVPLNLKRRTTAGVDEFRIDGKDFLVISQYLAGLEWVMYYLFPKHHLTMRTQNAVVMAVIFSGLIVALALLFRERRLKNLSRRKAMDAERIGRINQKLEEEIQEHRRTEKMLRETQEELIQTGKLAALGEMSAVIVHELNQPISAIRTYAASTKLMSKMDRGGEVQANLDTISELVERMASITGQLKAFARKSPGNLEDIDLRQPVQYALSLLRHQAAANDCTIDVEMPPEPLIVVGDSVRLSQVFVNIVRNALDAVRMVDTKRIAVVVRKTGSSAEVIVTDTGTGISPEIAGNIFQPFFTTKGVGEGMGLGLSISRNIIRNLKGDITCEDREGGGTSFTVRLPLKDGAAT